MRGVILAGGKGTRLGELTRATNKHLLPVGSWPMVCHPLTKMVVAGVQDILLVSGPEHMGDFARLLGSGCDYGCQITYRVQDEPSGVAQALFQAENFCRGERFLVLLGDNIFHSSLETFLLALLAVDTAPDCAWVVLKRVSDPGRYGVAELRDMQIVSIEEKPADPRSDLAVVGIYSYPADVFDVIRTLRPSARGELEITDVNRHYLERGRLRYWMLDKYWIDAGSPEALAAANEMVRHYPPRF